jgi:hypothetical protein
LMMHGFLSMLMLVFLKHSNYDCCFSKIVKPLLAKFKFTQKIIAYVKDEGSNLNTLAIAFFIIISCEPL